MTHDSDTTRNRILSSAGPIFARKGFRGATVREICDAAKVNLASINYYFGDKQRLYVEVLKSARDAQQSRFPYSDFLDHGEPAERLRDFVGVLVQRLGIGAPADQERWELQLLVRELLRPGEAGREIVEQVFAPYFEKLLVIISQLSPVELTREKRLQIGFSVIGQCLFYRVAEPIIEMLAGRPLGETGWETAAIADHITEFTLRSIAGRGLKTEPVTGSRL